MPQTLRVQVLLVEKLPEVNIAKLPDFNPVKISDAQINSQIELST